MIMEQETKNNEGQEPEQETTPLDSIIQRVESYKEDPKLVTPETMSELLEELVDLKSFTDGDDPTDTEDDTQDNTQGESPSLVIAIGRKMKKGKEGM